MITIGTRPHYQTTYDRKVMEAPVSVALLMLVERDFAHEAHIEQADPTKLVVQSTFYGHTDTTTYSGSEESMKILLRAAGLQLLLRESRTRPGGLETFNEVEQLLYLRTVGTMPFIATDKAVGIFKQPDRRFIFGALCEPTNQEEVSRLASMDMRGLFGHIARKLLVHAPLNIPN